MNCVKIISTKQKFLTTKGETTMKKTISTILVCVLLVGTIFSLASCEVFGMMFGTYENGGTTLEFSFNKVTKTVIPVFGNEPIVTEGEFKIDENAEGRKTITITYEGEDPVTYFFATGTDSNDGAYIELSVDLGFLGESPTRYYKK
jgi:hypothetical protein